MEVEEGAKSREMVISSGMVDVTSAGDLGLDPRNVETKLQNILEMCTKWNAILLLDEADVFLEQRSLHELERNKLVSIFLRILEY